MENIGQFISDLIQTPEGVASLLGAVIGIILV